MDEFKIENVPYFTQRDNQYFDKESKTNVASISCFPTSLAMCIAYCLNTIQKDKSAIGCSEDKQIEDYINELLDDPETTTWLKKNFPLSSWIWKYKRRTIYVIEEYIFNRLINPLGFTSKFKDDLDYNQMCDKLEETQLPMVIGGNFSSISFVGGHMNCLIGFNRLGMKETYTNDPYGNALTNYKDANGANMRYSYKYFLRDDNKHYLLVIERIKV